jgi:hypothetical protein
MLETASTSALTHVPGYLVTEKVEPKSIGIVVLYFRKTEQARGEEAVIRLGEFYLHREHPSAGITLGQKHTVTQRQHQRQLPICSTGRYRSKSAPKRDYVASALQQSEFFERHSLESTELLWLSNTKCPMLNPREGCPYSKHGSV